MSIALAMIVLMVVLLVVVVPGGRIACESTKPKAERSYLLGWLLLPSFAAAGYWFLFVQRTCLKGLAWGNCPVCPHLTWWETMCQYAGVGLWLWAGVCALAVLFFWLGMIGEMLGYGKEWPTESEIRARIRQNRGK